MIRLQDIADMAGVSRTTVSNVLHGKTKRVSQDTIDKIKKILEENDYVPNMGSMMLTGKGSKIIGFVLGYERVHGYHAIMDPFVGELLASVRAEAERLGYYVMVIGGDKEERIVEIASRWSVEGLIFIGYSEKRYKNLRKKLNKKAVLVDTYTEEGEYTYQNVGIDDYDGGYQLGKYLVNKGYTDAIFMAEDSKVLASMPASNRTQDAFSGLVNNERWKGFKKAMEENGRFCSTHRFVVVSRDLEERKARYEEMLPVFLKAKAVAYAADYNAIELINFLHDHDIKVPEQVAVAGFDDCIYAEYVRPRLTTVHQDVGLKGKTAAKRLIRMLEGEELQEMNVSSGVRLVVRESC